LGVIRPFGPPRRREKILIAGRLRPVSFVALSESGFGTGKRDPATRFSQKRKESATRFMVILKANKDSETGAPLKWELIEAMGRFNEEMVKAGVFRSRAPVRRRGRAQAGVGATPIRRSPGRNRF
jgi:hypothetical protein